MRGADERPQGRSLCKIWKSYQLGRVKKKYIKIHIFLPSCKLNAQGGPRRLLFARQDTDDRVIPTFQQTCLTHLHMCAPLDAEGAEGRRLRRTKY